MGAFGFIVTWYLYVVVNLMALCSTGRCRGLDTRPPHAPLIPTTHRLIPLPYPPIFFQLQGLGILRNRYSVQN
jgi:hypothetical protein